MAEKEFGLKIQCQHCLVKGQLNFAGWMVRVTGGLEIICPRCGKKSVYLGRFGQDLHVQRAIEDVGKFITDSEKETGPEAFIKSEEEDDPDE